MVLQVPDEMFICIYTLTVNTKSLNLIQIQRLCEFFPLTEIHEAQGDRYDIIKGIDQTI